MSKLIALLLGVALLGGCVSSGPQTRYYALFAENPAQTYPVANRQLSLGIGPIVLPEFLQNPAVVSVTRSQQVRVSGYSAWAGDLASGVSRVLADDLGRALQLDAVWAFPWDNRVRPSYQIRIVLEEFSGVRGGQVNLRAKWTLLNQRGSEALLTGSETLQLDSRDDSIDAYVAALNHLLHRFAASLVAQISPQLNR